MSLFNLLKIDCLLTLKVVILIGVCIDEFWPDVMLITFRDGGMLKSEEKNVEMKEEKIDHMTFVMTNKIRSLARFVLQI